MATSGENVGVTIVDTFCTNPTRYWHRFDEDCNFSGEVDVYTDSDGSAIWTCPYCGHVNTTTCERLGIE